MKLNNKMLKTDMFGYDKDKTCFVVVNDKIVYQDGLWNNIFDSNALENIVAVFKPGIIDCFKELEDIIIERDYSAFNNRIFWGNKSLIKEIFIYCKENNIKLSDRMKELCNNCIVIEQETFIFDCFVTFEEATYKKFISTTTKKFIFIPLFNY